MSEAGRQRMRDRYRKMGLVRPLVCYRDSCGHMQHPERMCRKENAKTCEFRKATKPKEKE